MPDMVLLETEEKMQKAVDSFRKTISQIRTGRANAAILDIVMVDYYGCPTPLRQIASVTVPEATQLYIKPYDKSSIKDIVAGLNASGLGLTPNSDGVGIRLIFPSLTEDRRRELVKLVNKETEGARVAIRNCRREGIDEIKKLKLPEDDEKFYLDEVQKLTDTYVEKAEQVAKEKEKDLMTI